MTKNTTKTPYALRVKCNCGSCRGLITWAKSKASLSDHERESLGRRVATLTPLYSS